jgi:hypothetical protein
LSTLPRGLPSGRKTEPPKLGVLSVPEPEEPPDIDERKDEAADDEETTKDTKRKSETRWKSAFKRVTVIARRSRDKVESEACLDRFGNLIIPGQPAGEDDDLKPNEHSPKPFIEVASTASTISSSTASKSFQDSVSPRQSITSLASSTSSLQLGPSTPSRRRNSLLERNFTKEAKIVDLRLFDFALARDKAKTEITYVEVDIPVYSQQSEGAKREERFVLQPEQVKKVQIRCLGYEDLPINVERFTSNSGSFPLQKTWARPKWLRYPIEAELTLEVTVKNIRYTTQPHRVNLKGTSSIFTRLQNFLVGKL